MPLTDHDKELQVHSRPFTDFLAAVPIKKRRLLFHRSPSPPPQSPYPVIGDCNIPESKPKSPEISLPCSKIVDNSASVNIVMGKVAACESHDQAIAPLSLTPADNGLPKEKFESSECVSTLNTGDQVELFSKEAPEDCLVLEKKTDSSKSVSPLSVSGKNNVQVDTAKGEVSSSEPTELLLTQAGCVLPEKKPETPNSCSPFSRTGGTTLKVNAVTGEDPCKPSVLPLPTPTDCDMSERKHESSKPEPPILESIGNPAQLNSVTGNDNLIEPYEKPKPRDINVVPKREMLPNFNNPGSRLYLGANSVEKTANMQEMIFCNKCATSAITGSTIISSATKQTFQVPEGPGSGEGKFTHRQGVSVKQVELELKNIESDSRNIKTEADSGILYLNRSNWDLNTIMDTWVNSSAESSFNNETSDQSRQVLGGVQQQVRKQMFFKEHIRTDIMSENNWRQKVDSNPEALLELQLMPPSLPNPCISLGTHEAVRDKSFLSLATKPVMSTTSQSLAIGTTVKSEPIEKVQKETAKVQLGLLKSFSLDLKNVKSKPCDGLEISKTTISSNLKLACGRSVKPEPCEDQAQVNIKDPEDVGHKSAPKSMLVHQNAGEDNNKASDMASKPLALNTLLRPCTNFSNDSSSIADKVNQYLLSENYMPTYTTVTQATNVTATESSALRSRFPISSGNDMNLSLEPSEKSCLPLPFLPENTPKTDAELSFASQKEPSNVHHFCNNSLTDDILRNLCVNSEVIVSDEVADEVGASSEVIEEHCDNTSKSATLHVSGESMNTIRKQGGKSDEDFEDGEVRDSALKKTVEGSQSLAEGESAKASDSISSVNVPVSMSLLADENENEYGILGDKIESCSSDVGAPTTDSCEERLSKSTDKAPQDHLKIDESSEREIKSSGHSSITNFADSQSDAAGSQQQNAERPKPAEHCASGKTEPSDKGSLTKDANDRNNNRRIIYLNSTSNCLTSGKRKSTLDRSMSSRGVIERPVDGSFRIERSCSRGSRDESSNEWPQRIENERNYGRHVEKCSSDNMHIRSRANRVNAMRGDRNSSNADHLSEQMNSSAGIRYSRPISNCEVAIDGSVDGSSRLRRKLTSEEMGDPSRLQCQRRSFEGRIQMPLVHRSIGREVPEFALSHSNPRFQFERAEGIVIHRERRSLSPTIRSLSPTLRRGGPQSSLGSQQRRPSNSFNRPRELIQHRSPQIMRLNRRQSPREHRCFPEEGIVRRRGSPYGMEEVGPPREEFPRNMRMFNVVDPREITEEEDFFDLREFGDMFLENRRRVDRRGPPIRGFRQRCVDNDESESFRFRSDAGPPRPLRMRSNATDSFIEGSGPSRDFDVRFRNRLGNSSNRLGGIVEEQENYRFQGEQEWPDAGFNDSRPKRRRF